MSDTSPQPSQVQEQSVSAQFNKKKNILTYAEHTYVNSSWKTWCWVLLVIFIIIPVCVGLLSIIFAGVLVGSAVNAAQDAMGGSGK